MGEMGASSASDDGGVLRRIALYGLGLLLAAMLALSYATTSRANRAKTSGRVAHTCSVTDHAFIETAKTNMAAIDLWGQQYLDGDAEPTDVADEAGRAAKIVGATKPTDPSLTQTRKLLVGMFTEYRRAMEAEAKKGDAGDHIFHAYGLANFAHDVLVQAEPALGRRGCDVAALL
jgi:hypothetical protein